MFDLNAFTKEVHQNAVDHGWWDNERTMSELIALIHSEWSEALEEYRANRPYHYFPCNAGGLCVDDRPGENVTCGSRPYDPENPTAPCSARSKKPEGIAVELIDGCIRILDLVGNFEIDLTDVDFDELVEDFSNRIGESSLPHLIATAHWKTSSAFAQFIGINTEADPDEGFTGLVSLCLSICGWVKHQGFDPVELLLEKHNYNKGRSYKHGGKVI